MKKAERIDEVVKMMDKYCSLVWLARSNPDPSDEHWAETPNEIFLEAFKQQKIVENKYPKEVDELSSDAGDYHHGFNSGMLAGLRYALEMLDGDAEFAQDSFPNVDS